MAHENYPRLKSYARINRTFFAKMDTRKLVISI